jgi:hypothetical protein
VRRDVAGHGHRVDVPGHDHALGLAELGTGDHGVAVPVRGQVRQRRHRLEDRIGEVLLVAADRLDVDEPGCQLCRSDGEVEFHAQSLAGRLQPSVNAAAPAG